jgi:alkanesulfonate monooxygenase SsuD/methylene tetrahydromethanopterin reductase-like flavin-dependent oxidoreductase (luciferase family)
MKFGLLYIPDYHPEAHGSFATYYDQMLEQIVTAEALGFDGAWFAEHRIPGFAFGNPAVFMAAAARLTRRIRLGTAVALLPLHNPVRLLEDYSMVDVLSGGRLDFGVGRGLYKYDYDLSSVDMHQSRPRFDECLAVILQAWQHEVFSHQGQFFQYDQHSITPRPVQQPHPPIYMACVMSPESYEWAGAHGHHILTAPFFFTRFEEQQTRLALYSRALETAGVDPASRDVVGAYHLYCGDSDAEVRRIAEPGLRTYQAFTKGADLLRGAQRDAEQYKAWQGFFANRETITFEQMRATRAVMGTPDECAARIGQLSREYGLNYFIFEINYGALPHGEVLRSLERFAREVMPRFR